MGRLGKGKQIGQVAPGYEEQAEIARFIQEGLGEDCNLTGDQIFNFLQQLRNTGMNVTDVIAILDIAYRQGRIPIKFSRRPRETEPTQTGFRGAGLQFSGRTLGPDRKGNRKRDRQLPSLMWDVLNAGCGNLAVLDQIIREVTTGSRSYNMQPVNLELLPAESPELTVNINKGLTAFLASHPYCRGNERQIRQFLNLIYSSHITAEDIFDIMRILRVEGRIDPGISRYGWRAAGLTMAPRTTARPNTKAARNEKKNVAYSFLWYLLENYCQQMGDILTFTVNTLNQAAQSRSGQVGQQGGQQMGAQMDVK